MNRSLRLLAIILVVGSAAARARAQSGLPDAAEAAARQVMPDSVEALVDDLRARMNRDLTDDELAWVRAHCALRSPDAVCAAVVAACAVPDLYELGSNLHRACEHVHVVLPRGALVGLYGAGAAFVEDADDVLFTAGVAYRLVVQRLRLAVRADLRLGGGSEGGFAWEGGVGVGYGTMLGRRLAAGVTIGVGGSGLTGDRIPAALEVPIELFATGHAGGRISFAVYRRETLIASADARDDGATTGLLDEATTGVAVGFGKNGVHLGHAHSGGVTVGAELREQLDTRIFLVTLGWGTFRHGAGAR